VNLLGKDQIFQNVKNRQRSGNPQTKPHKFYCFFPANHILNFTDICGFANITISIFDSLKKLAEPKRKWSRQEKGFESFTSLKLPKHGWIPQNLSKD
jgi:hypothetical protein